MPNDQRARPNEARFSELQAGIARHRPERGPQPGTINNDMKSIKTTLMDRLRQQVYEMTQATEATASDLENAFLRLQECGGHAMDGQQAALEREEYESATAKDCFERRAELRGAEEVAEEVNPLDDDERLREVRLMVFGCAPE